MTNSEQHHTDTSFNWLIFFFVCFAIIMAIGVWAIFCYNCNAPAPQPGSGGHSGMIMPQVLNA